jgi:hypothetical protein
MGEGTEYEEEGEERGEGKGREGKGREAICGIVLREIELSMRLCVRVRKEGRDKQSAAEC